MRIVFDCFKLVKNTGKSIGIYNLAHNLVNNLADSQSSSDDKNIKRAELIVIGNKYNRNDFDIPGVCFVMESDLDPLSKLDCLIWELGYVIKRLKRLGADKVVFPRGFAALIHPVNDIIIIHDLIPFYYKKKYPGYFGRIENAYIMYRLKASAKGCHQIVTISEASKTDILKYTHVDENKITVIYNGCNKIEKVDKNVDIDPYIIAVTSGLPHKNAEGIVRSYGSYCKQSKYPLKLVIIGIDDVNKFDLPDDIKRKIECYKYIEDEKTMHQLIADATIFLFLSFIEGFGFPPIEAMQLGVPVICSDNSSLPEIVGDAAILVNPNDHNEVGIQIDRLINDVDLQQSLITRGLANIQRFSWDSRMEMYWKVILG